MNKKYKFETNQIHVGQEECDKETKSRAVPIYATTSYIFDNVDHAKKLFSLEEEGNIYSRMNNPTNRIFEKRIALLEGGIDAICLSSGAAAVSYAILNIAKNGDHIVSSKNLYGGTYNLFSNSFKDFGIEVSFVDCYKENSIESNIKNNTKCIYIESMGNPNCDIPNVRLISTIAKKHKIPLIIDSTFATPYLFRPIEFGANIVVHSATKFICGHGTVVGGVIIDSGNFDWEESGKFTTLTQPNQNYHGVIFTKISKNNAYITKLRAVLLRDMGACLSPFHSFLFLQGLETLSLRMERHVYNALKVVNYLNKHPKVKIVNHPSLETSPYNNLYKEYYRLGGGSIFTFELKGNYNNALTFVNNIKLFSLLANVADAKSLIIHPASTTHSQLSEKELDDNGIKPTTIRLSIGLEHIDDIIEALDNAFNLI